MSTIGAVIAAAREELLGVHRAEYDLVGSALTTTATELTVADGATGIVRGAILAIEDELVWCRSKPDAANVVTVVRGFLGSTAVQHAADTLIDVQPRFPNRMLRRALVNEIRSWEPRLFRVDTVDIALADDVRGYEVPVAQALAYHVVEARISPDSRQWETNPLSWAKVDVTLDRAASMTDFPSGTAVVLRQPQSNMTGRTLRVTFAMPFDLTATTDATDLIDPVGLRESMEDVLRLGIAWRVLAPQEVLRTDIHAQGTSRDAAEVQVGAASATAASLKRLRDLRLSEEATTLRNLFGGW